MGMRDEISAFTAGRLNAIAGLGKTSHEAAEILGVPYWEIRKLARTHNITFVKDYRSKNKGGNQPRAEDMERRYRSGETLQSIGTDYGITRERVRQILSLRGVDSSDGGQSTKTMKGKVDTKKRINAESRAKWGCDREEYLSLMAIGKEMRAAGGTLEQTPTRAFSAQKRNAKSRGIEWRLSLWQWWTIWQESGRWSNRGRGHSYMMCRKGDAGAYAPGNVVIAPGHFNSSSGPHKKSGLPTGVTVRRGRFVAIICVDGTKKYLGVFGTPEQAHEAYLVALAAASKDSAERAA